ncbi:hypothetical protein NDI40_26545 [Microcoleus vaginatus ZQ-A3]|uniref:hypothetical protein n=1 Tax=Microcoleus vaginatus TaxID=119532 RepID=UPI00168398F2|nr:hypothetical protein [Microcoleus sp. FACHB-45]
MVIVDTYALLRNKLTHIKTGVQAPPEVVSLATTPTASLIGETPPTQQPQETALPTATPPQPEVFAPDPVPIQSKEPSLMSKLQAPNKEATVRGTVEMSETLHRKLSMLAAKTGHKKVDQSADVVGGWFERRGVGTRILAFLIHGMNHLFA